VVVVMISDTAIEAWRFASENNALDFKREQYKFRNATNRAKSELIKDIVAMGNAWREGIGYIVLGIDERAEKPNILTGIAEHIDDADMQQLVNSKLAKPMMFEYFTHTYQGMTFGIIKVPVQKRPVFLKSKFGILQADTVYVRRGTTTDIAKPNEVSLMRQNGSTTEPKIAVSLFNNQTRESSSSVDVENSLLIIEDSIPDYSESVPISGYMIGREVNRNYYRELIAYVNYKYSYIPLQFCVENSGDREAENLQIEIQVEKECYSDLLLDGNELHYPSRNPYDSILRPSKNSKSSVIQIDKYESHTILNIHINNIHAKRLVAISGTVYLQVPMTREMMLRVKVFYNGAESPVENTIKLKVKCEKYTLSFMEFKEKYVRTEKE